MLPWQERNVGASLLATASRPPSCRSAPGRDGQSARLGASIRAKVQGRCGGSGADAAGGKVAARYHLPMSSPPSYSARELAERFSLQLRGDGDVRLVGVATLA